MLCRVRMWVDLVSEPHSEGKSHSGRTIIDQPPSLARVRIASLNHDEGKGTVDPTHLSLSLSLSLAEAIHGALLVIGEMLRHTGEFMMPRFREVHSWWC